MSHRIRKIHEEVVHREIEAAKREHGDDWHGWLNNFHGNLPSGYRRRPSNRHDRILTRGSSPKIFGMTYSQFHEDVDHSTGLAGLDLGVIARFMKMTPCGRLSDIPRLYEYAIPAYVVLRQKGYHNYPDLTV